MPGVSSRGGRLIDKGLLYKLLNNRVYVGEAVHKGVGYPGEHEAIVSRAVGHCAFDPEGKPAQEGRALSRRLTPALLKGIIFAPNGLAMTPTHTRKRGRLYRYYVTTSVMKLGPDTCPIRSVSAAEIETAVIDQLRILLRSPEIIVKTWMAAREGNDCPIGETEVREALVQLDPLWDQLFPAEQARIVQLLVERVDIEPDGISIRLRTEGIGSVIPELRRQPALSRASLMKQHAEDRDATALTVRVPMSFQKRGGRKLVIVDGVEQPLTPIGSQIDGTLLKAVVQAFRWKGMLDAGKFATVGELARAEKLNVSYVAHILGLTLLAPNLVEAILDGTQPRTMQLQPLTRDFPTAWSSQNRRLGQQMAL